MKNEDAKAFLISQRLPGRPGCLKGVKALDSHDFHEPNLAEEEDWRVQDEGEVCLFKRNDL